MNAVNHPKTISDLRDDATFLHGLCQGVGVLYDEVQNASTPASNATHALIHEVIAKADRLSQELDELDTPNRRAQS
ncbi:MULTISPECIES: hypothetical protein [unclassified Roseovarius]|uniref:hypothetical protein n=1 Tax=unclassified Roseovarius TaxID=2614913 RepID=UPI00273EFE93|nr:MULTISPECIES: hypothetical protein [unclassified Roseovarius]